MARVQLQIDDPANRLTLHAIVQAAGHSVVDSIAEVAVTDNIESALDMVGPTPVLVLASASQIRDAVAAMRKGVYGYIFLPLQPGETDLMLQRALGSSAGARTADARPLNEVEAGHILDVVRQCKGNRAKAARVLGVGRNTLWRKLKQIESRSMGVSDVP